MARTEDIVLCSAKKNQGFERLLETVAHYRGDRDVYVVGATNVGKSSLINRLIRDYSDLDQELTVSRYPGTTLDMVNIPLDDGRYIIDTPGIVYPWRYSELVSREDLGTVMPENPLKPMVYQLNEGQTLFFGGFGRFDFLQGSINPLLASSAAGSAFIGPSWSGRIRYLRSMPGSCCPRRPRNGLKSFRNGRDTKSVFLRVRAKTCLSRLGWIKINGEQGALVAVHVPKGIKVLSRPSLI